MQRAPLAALLTLLILASPSAAQTAIALDPVLSGLSSPVYLTNARDGTNRLFIVEQPGRIKVLQPGAAAPTLFLDISAKLSAGGERGLLGLAFHPFYHLNRRFFVNYTRAGDGATVVSEFRASASNPNAADAAETVLLTVPQPFANHNGGMIEFGKDGYLYIGMGDGGSANDPGDRAQNVNNLLGKMLRIDVNRPAGSLPYSSPPDNPFFGAAAGRDEIFAVGFRNPFRWSFDRQTGQLWAGDVGQGQREEIDIVTLGGNYGWRVFEGTRCTGLGPASCASPGYTPPVFEYAHSAGRCSITGGYVYRGTRGSLPVGSYVYADYCTGEIFLYQGGSPLTRLLDTALNVASFGEDEAGELYVVGLGGTVQRIRAASTPPAPAPGPVIISEFRLRGARGALDEFVELYNNSDAAVTVSTDDGSTGWAVAASDGVTRFVVPAGTVIPARGHFLGVNSAGYSLGEHPAEDASALTATGDITYTADIPDNSGLALFRTANPANFDAARRLDAAGVGAPPVLYSEATPHPPLGSADAQLSLVRRWAGGRPQDTNNNAADFLVVSVDGRVVGGLHTLLGAPGPENLSAPLGRNAGLPLTLLDTQQAAAAPPNRVRDHTADPARNAALGTISIRRRLTNNTGGPVTRLRFRVADITAYPPPPGVADVRAITSADISVTLTNGTAALVRGTTLEQPPAQASGGGYNSTLAAGTVTLAAPLPAGASVNLQFLLGVQRTGYFRFFFDVEALP
ncbi:MAG TPA: PQQ-dependent sugar dehydrogenase [Pyrinomonadaceae bacterium]|nr:PQQ-dependent sugar dehydrogenase [Pyrinomonadaceae bacterium]